jgi:uncharacterized repeat protein (TIGR03837 family)
MLWDVFVRVIDNHGDIGVCRRLAAELASRGQAVRLWVDDASALAWMAPRGDRGVEVIPWSEPLPGIEPGDVVVEAFGCDIPAAFQAAIARVTARSIRQPAWINLEYLSAEPYVARSHGLASPVLSGPARGLTKHFFYPGFTAATGGLLRERDLAMRQAAFDRNAWLRAMGIGDSAGRRVSLFCYEPPVLGELLASWAADEVPTQLLVTAGRARPAFEQAVRALDASAPGWNAAGRLTAHHLPLLTQPDFDHLLWSCDINFVRGEDSLVRAIWAGRPFVWQLYPQHDGAHHAKLEAFLDWLGASGELREFFRAWNGAGGAKLAMPGLAEWAPLAVSARTRALALPELADSLLRFARGRARI